MKDTDERDRLEYPLPGPWGCLGVFPLIMALLLWFGVKPNERREPQRVGIISALVGVGLLGLLARSGVVLDRRGRTVRKWRGLLILMFGRETPVDPGARISITAELRVTGKSRRSYHVYPVKFESETTTVLLSGTTDPDESRLKAEKAAEFLGIPLVDRSSGQDLVREAGHARESLRERSRREGVKTLRAGPPPGGRMTVDSASSEAVITIPAVGFGPPQLFSIVGSLVVVGIIAIVEPFWKGFGQGKLANAIAWGGTVFCALIVLSAILKAVTGATSWERLRVSPEAIHVEQYAFFRAKKTKLDAQEIEDVALDPPYAETPGGEGRSRSVAVRARTSTCRVGFELMPEERIWLRDELRYIFTLERS